MNMTINSVNVAVLLNGLENATGSVADMDSKQVASLLISEGDAKATTLAVWSEMWSDEPEIFEATICTMYANLASLDDVELARSYMARIRTRLGTIADNANNPRKVPKKDSNGYNGYSFQLSGKRSDNKGEAKFTKGMETTASNIKKAKSAVRRRELLAMMIIKAGLTSANLDAIKSEVVKLETAGNK